MQYGRNKTPYGGRSGRSYKYSKCASKSMQPLLDVFLLALILRRPITVYVDYNIDHSYRNVCSNKQDEFDVHLDSRSAHYRALLPNSEITWLLIDNSMFGTEFLNFFGIVRF